MLLKQASLPDPLPATQSCPPDLQPPLPGLQWEPVGGELWDPVTQLQDTV